MVRRFASAFRALGVCEYSRLRYNNNFDEQIFGPRTMSFIPPPPKLRQVGNKTQGSNAIMSTSFALEFWSNKLIDVDIILSFTLTF